MKAVIQRVTQAQVRIEGNVVGSIGKGFLILLGVGQDDSEEQVEKLWSKIFRMRIFADENGKTNLSIKDVGGEILAVSNFTLLAETKRTNRPSFSHAAPPEQALALYNMFCEELNTFVSTKRGIFGEHMHIETNLDGPVTIVIDTKNP